MSEKKHQTASFLPMWPFKGAVSTVAMVAAGVSAAWANPQGGTVVRGEAVIETHGDRLVIRQASQKAIAKWDAFSIGNGETTQFVQPNSNAIMLNRVTGGDPSHILGNLNANGRVMLINPNGILFGVNSKVDVAGLTASTANITDEDFWNGRYDFEIDGAEAAIVQKGMIKIKRGGIAALLASAVRNEGSIIAPLGTITLAAGRAFTIDFSRCGLVQVKLPTESVPALPDGRKASALVENSKTGVLEASGGRVMLTGRAVEGVLRNTINTDGVISVRSFERQGPP